ncbi:MAG: methyltransferase [Gammaproteobacteria bacterium]|nr:MAG: methyltransferase [Gammaproteobacteria bacterium]
MANERLTENILRDFVRNDEDYKNIIIEKQKSASPKIDKLLKNSSKSGIGKGYPEFIIQYKNNPDFIIVVECKADIKFHKSEYQNKHKDYAVDGVLLYSSFLAKEYDVLSIAISGQSKNNLKISHFLQLKGTDKYHPIFKDDIFLNLADYLNGYETDERKFNQDFQQLLKYSKTLNDNLHTLKVPESDRSLLISGTLIALHDKAFYNSYKYQSPQELSENLINTIKNKLIAGQNEHIKDIVTSYNFIKTHTILAKQENKLRDVIVEVDEKINNFIKTYKYFDTLGQFYIEFLRYANNDKGLGIVLTPPHITDLFCEIANINKDSIVLDTCTGTGGFLISAMKKMIIDAAGDKQKELEIKSQQIIGVELQHSIFSLTCSNMYIHGDGRSNLIKGSCFDEKIIEQIKKYKPNVGFLNPPYKVKSTDTEEFQFILNNANFLQKGSYLVAIIPTSCLIANNGLILSFKEKILKNHTLDAVFSMPSELFYNSKVAVSTCIIVLKAHEKHQNNYKTYFAIWNDDGFTKTKHLGRSDSNNNWDIISKKYLTNYKNKDEYVGHSIKHIVSHKDEWIAERYIKINYLKTKKQDFKNFLFNYIGNLFLLKKIDTIKIESKIKNKTQLINQEFKYFNLSGKDGIFKIEKGERLNKNTRTKGQVPLITSSSLNNGISALIDHETFKDNKKIFSNKITIDMLSNVFYHGYKYYSDDNVHTLTMNLKFLKHDNKYIHIFVATLLQQISIRYNYGRQVRLKRLESETILLPIDKNGKPDWQFMKNYIKSLAYSTNL